MNRRNKLSFQHKCKLGFSQVDAGGVIFCSRIIDLAHEAYEAFLDELEFSINYILYSTELLIPIVSVTTKFKKTMRLGDTFVIDLIPKKKGDHSFQIDYMFYNSDSILSATVVTNHVVLDKKSKKVRKIPKKLFMGIHKFSSEIS